MEKHKRNSKGRTWRKRKNVRKYINNQSSRVISYAGLISWSLKKGLLIHAITPKVFKETGRGLKTTKSVNPPDSIIALPFNLLITFDTVLENSILNFIFCNHTSISQKYLFIIFLLIEKRKGKDSQFFHYIDTLPTSFSTPSYINQDETKKCPFFIQEEIGLQKRLILNAVENIAKLQHLISFGPCLKAEVKWAWNVINTRSVYFNAKHLKCFKKNASITVDFALAPVLDLLNHTDTANVVAGFNKDSQHYEIITNDVYTPGSQLFINYGPHSNRKLFYEYGFVLSKNIHSVIPVPAGFLNECFNMTSNPLKFETMDFLDINKMQCNADGFNWIFEAVAHINQHIKLGTLKSAVFKSFIDKPCDGICIIEDIKRKTLKYMIEEHNSWLKNLYNCSTPSVVVAKILIESEVILLSKLLESLSSRCLLDCSL